MNPTRVRFFVLALLCSLSFLTYLDRVCVSRVQNDIQRDLGLSEKDLAWVFTAFVIGYTIFEMPGGWMGDVWGSRGVIFRIVVWWSFFTAVTGYCDILLRGVLPSAMVTTTLVLWALVVVRFLFGCGEAGAYPNMARVVAVWFPFHERAFAQGFIWFTARLGGAVAPVLMGVLSREVGWRRSFLILGIVGIIWAVFFYLRFRNRPEDVPACNEAERELIQRGKAENSELAHLSLPWRQIFFSWNMWAMGLAGFMVTFGWYFYPTWQPRFYNEVHKVSFEGPTQDIVNALPFLFGAFGALAGGKLSDILVSRIGKRWGRSLLGILGFSGAGVCVFFTGFSPSLEFAVALLCLAFFLQDLAIPPLWAVAADVSGKYAGTVSGLLNTIGGFGAMLGIMFTPYMRSWLPDDYSTGLKWQITFIALSFSWFIAAAAWYFVDASSPLIRSQDNKQ